MSCSICDRIPASLVAVTGRDESLPADVDLLRRHKDRYGALGTEVDLWECPECGLFYIFTTETAFTGSGAGDADTLDRLTREQSDVVHAMLSCTGDPVAIQEAVFALPAIAFAESLSAAYRNDRDFVALFTPRLVHEYAKRGQHSYGSHPTRDVLHSLVETQPTYAREVLAATTSLPAELRANLGDLEQRCHRNLGIPVAR
ncbi:MAG: hypothetical protein ABI867_25445 [Kofleriaceae bacterium]